MSVGVSQKIRDESWDFRTANTKQYVHCFHIYPAMMIPQVAGRILDEYGKGSALLLDPYCGTGTSLVEANLRGIEAVGTDINPLARLIAKAKTTPIELKLLDQHIKEFNNFLFSFTMGGRRPNPHIPNFTNIDYWFKKETQYLLAVVKDYIDRIDHTDVQDFFKVAFSETVREASLTRKGEFKLYRMKESQIRAFNPDVLGLMADKLMRNRKGLEEYINIKKQAGGATICDFNTVYEPPTPPVEPESVDIVVTSPPYGDSRTTVAYGQFSRLSNQWLGFEELNEVDKRSMGGRRSQGLREFGFAPLDRVISQIAETDEQRAADVVSFYVDYLESINNVARVVKRGGIVAYVVGNRRVKGIEIPNDEITREFFERNGFRFLKTLVRSIPNKRMPKRNSPTNVAGVTDRTMSNEYIVILKKEG